MLILLYSGLKKQQPETPDSVKLSEISGLQFL